MTVTRYYLRGDIHQPCQAAATQICATQGKNQFERNASAIYHFAMLTERQASYEPDFAAILDKEEEIIADELGVSIEIARKIIQIRDQAAFRHQAEILARVIGLLLRAKNMPVMVHALAIAFGLDQLNGAHSQSEIARQLGCTRALISHYVLGWRDVLAGGLGGAFDCMKYRKANSTRSTYAEKATNPVIQIKKQHRHGHSRHTPA